MKFKNTKFLKSLFKNTILFIKIIIMGYNLMDYMNKNIFKLRNLIKPMMD